jgi:hypothetical protein
MTSSPSSTPTFSAYAAAARADRAADENRYEAGVALATARDALTAALTAAERASAAVVAATAAHSAAIANTERTYAARTAAYDSWIATVPASAAL